MIILENYGVQELNAKEIRETEGGFFFTGLAIIGALFAGALTVAVVGSNLINGRRPFYTGGGSSASAEHAL